MDESDNDANSSIDLEDFSNICMGESDDYDDASDDLTEDSQSRIEIDYRGGHVIDGDGACDKHKEFLEKLGWTPNNSSTSTNTLYPWKHIGEIWLTDLLVRRVMLSHSIIDELLNAFANGRLSMVDGPLQFSNSREMIKLLDAAARSGVVSCHTFTFLPANSN